ncbi:MAG: hypothetical protein VKJ64_11880 [Leptolyngbyaceae bacterium]|nr:hypothetical protein [Leptolyngbyaceae bacterium]
MSSTSGSTVLVKVFTQSLTILKGYTFKYHVFLFLLDVIQRDRPSSNPVFGSGSADWASGDFCIDGIIALRLNSIDFG